MIIGNCLSNVACVMSDWPEQKRTPPQAILRNTLVLGSYSRSILLSPAAGGNIARTSTLIRDFEPNRSGLMWLELTERAFPERMRARSLVPARQQSMSCAQSLVLTVLSRLRPNWLNRSAKRAKSPRVSPSIVPSPFPSHDRDMNSWPNQGNPFTRMRDAPRTLLMQLPAAEPLNVVRSRALRSRNV